MPLSQSESTAAQEDIDGVTRAALDYIDGYTTGDASRHAAAYHPECIKRRFSDESGVDQIIEVPPERMVELAASGDHVIEDCESEVIIDAISENIATVRVYSCRWVDFLHVAKARGAWRLLHVTWHGRGE